MSCCAVGCRNRFTKNEDLHFYRIPSTKTPFAAERRRLWLEAINRTDWTEEIIQNSRLCSAHFVSGKASLDPKNPDFVPSLFAHTKNGGIKKMDSFGYRFCGRSKPTEAPGRSAPSDTPRSAAQTSTAAEPSTDPRQRLAVKEELEPQPISEEPLQHCAIKDEQITVVVKAEEQESLEIKEEPVDMCISQDTDAGVKPPELEASSDGEQLQYVTVNVEEDWSESEDSSPPRRNHSIDVFMELEQPPREDKTCRLCGTTFERDAHLIKHVETSHKGHKAFQCLECSKEFEQRHQLIMHVRIHTGEKPFSCDFCGKTFSQNSSRIVHMRVHTGEKPYFCSKCGKSFATGKHLKYCKAQNKSDIVEVENGNAEEHQKKKKAFKCFECNREFNQKQQLVLHLRVHTGEKPYTCDFCGKTFTQNSSRVVHMRQHTGEKPYLCQKCGKRFASSHHLKHCTGKPIDGTEESVRCTTCGKTFHTDSNLKVHMEVHNSWKRHISRRQKGQGVEGGGSAVEEGGAAESEKTSESMCVS